jgi:ATP phosphoribosyltransferase regulatory subunit HisZ
MIGQGKRIIPEIQDALNNYFEEYEVMAVEMPLIEDISG